MMKSSTRHAHKLAVAFFCLISLATLQADGHFVWVFPDRSEVKIVFGEGLEPAKAEYLDRISKMSVLGRSQNGKRKSLAFQKRISDELGWYSIESDGTQSQTEIDVDCPYGVFSRGVSPFLLHYRAKYVQLPKVAELEIRNEGLDLHPSIIDGKLKLKAYYAGKPVEDVDLVAYSTESDSTETITKSDGVAWLKLGQRLVIRGKYVVDQSGKRDGQSYEQQQYYTTLVVDTESLGHKLDSATHYSSTVDSVSEVNPMASKLAALPFGVTSFGAAKVGSNIFLLGGQKGKAHSYADSYQNDKLWSLNTEDASAIWLEVEEYRGLQGFGLVVWNNQLIAIGGLEARNAEGDEHDLHSVDQVQSFDCETKAWMSLPNLPVGLSSFDACVVNSRIYVLGGWTMAGNKDPVWSKRMYQLDLADVKAGWDSDPWPNELRAHSVQHLDGKVYAIGGIDSNGEPSSEVHVYNLLDKKWSRGPSLPTKEQLKGFGCASLVVNNRLYVSTYEGQTFRLAPSKNEWETVLESEEGRFFHRLIELPNAQVAVVGGANMTNGKMTDVDVVRLPVVQAKSSDPSSDNNRNDSTTQK